MANSLEKFFKSKIKQMPPVEFVMTADQLKRPPSNKKTPSSVRGKQSRPLPSGNVPASASNSAAENLNNVKKPDLGRVFFQGVKELEKLLNTLYDSQKFRILAILNRALK